jgi:hypothetical protein
VRGSAVWTRTPSAPQTSRISRFSRAALTARALDRASRRTVQHHGFLHDPGRRVQREGDGLCVDRSSTIASVVVTNDRLDVCGEYGAGATESARNLSCVDSIAVVSGDVESFESAGAGIGCGSGVASDSVVSSVWIVGGHLSASSAAIGASHALHGRSLVLQLCIVGGHICENTSSGRRIGSRSTPSNGSSFLTHILLKTGSIFCNKHLRTSHWRRFCPGQWRFQCQRNILDWIRIDQLLWSPPLHDISMLTSILSSRSDFSHRSGGKAL